METGFGGGAGPGGGLELGGELPGWEELTDAGVTHLLRTVLSKAQAARAAAAAAGGGESAAGAAGAAGAAAAAAGASAGAGALEPAKDTARLRKHLTILADRLAKGGKLALAAGSGGGGGGGGGGSGGSGVVAEAGGWHAANKS